MFRVLTLCFSWVFVSSAWSPPMPVASRPSTPWSSAAWPSFSHPMPTSPATSCYNPALPPNAAQWSGWGGNIYNNRWASENTAIHSGNIVTLKEHCNIAYSSGGVSATPTINGNIAYYPTWSGTLVALDYTTCRISWQINVTALVINYAPLLPEQIFAAPMSRTSPQLDNGVLYFGTLAHALLVAVDVRSGTILDMVSLNTHPLAVITMSPTVYNGRLFVGISSDEEPAAALVAGYVCCSFVGNMVGVDFDGATKKLVVAWDTPMISDADARQGWSGAAIWGSQPSVDEARSQLFIATGNSYTSPDAIKQCQQDTANLTTVTNDPCLPPNVWQESVLALDITTGIPNWVRQLSPIDIWTVACGVPGLERIETLCPGTFGPDADFGMAPSFVPGSASTPLGKDVVVVGQKNGRLHTLSAQAGSILWSTQTNPGGDGGGLIWGIAVDDEQVYFTAANSAQAAFTLEPSGGTIRNSGFGSASLMNGSLLWEVAAPLNSLSYGMPSVVGDVVLIYTTNPINVTDPALLHGEFLALDKHTGSTLLDIPLDGLGYGGIAVQDKYVLFGTGYNVPIVGITPGSFHVLKVG